MKHITERLHIFKLGMTEVGAKELQDCVEIIYLEARMEGLETAKTIMQNIINHKI
jgi:hypothetical protein